MNLTKKKYEEEIRKARRQGERDERERIASLLEARAFPNLIVEEIRRENEAFTLSLVNDIFKRNYALIPYTSPERVRQIEHMLAAVDDD